MSRQKQHAIRNALFQIENSIPKADRSQIAEWERDLIAVANCAVWDGNLKTLHRCLRRLQGSPERRAQYNQVMGLLAA